jgi:hypothetical protein
VTTGRVRESGQEEGVGERATGRVRAIVRRGACEGSACLRVCGSAKECMRESVLLKSACERACLRVHARECATEECMRESVLLKSACERVCA